MLPATTAVAILSGYLLDVSVLLSLNVDRSVYESWLCLRGCEMRFALRCAWARPGVALGRGTIGRCRAYVLVHGEERAVEV